MAFPAEDAAVAAPPPVPPRGDSFGDPASFEDGSAILGLPVPSSYGYRSVLGDEDEDGEAYNDMSDDDSSSSSDSDSDSEFEDHGNRVRFWDGDAAAAGSGTDDLVAGGLTFLGQRARFASFQGAAGFMRLSQAQATGAGPGGETTEDRKVGAIVVHYRLTRFSRPRQQNGGDAHGVEVRDFGTALHHVRYLVPLPIAGGDPASTLRLVGAALAADVYPYRHYVQLQALWSGLVAALPARVSARATRLVVTFDVGVLRAEDRMPPIRSSGSIPGCCSSSVLSSSSGTMAGYAAAMPVPMLQPNFTPADLVQAFKSMTAVVSVMQRQLADLSMRISAISSRPSSSTFQYGRPGYGGLPPLPMTEPATLLPFLDMQPTVPTLEESTA